MNRIKVILLFVFMLTLSFGGNIVIAQDSIINKTGLEIDFSSPDSVLRKIMHDTIWYFIDRDLIKTKELIDIYSDFIIDNKIDEYSVDLCNIRSAYFNYRGLNDSSIFYLEKSIDMIKEIAKDSTFIYGKNQLPYLYSNIAIIYDEMGMCETAVEFQFKSMYEIEDVLKVDSSNIKMQALYASGNTELGMYYSNFGDTLNSEKFFSKGIELSKKYSDDDAIAYAEFNYGVYLLDVNKVDTALKIFNKIDAYYKLSNNTYNQILAKLNISGVYNIQGKYDLAMQMADSCTILSDKYGFYSLYRTSKRRCFFYSVNFSQLHESIALGEEYVSIASTNNNRLGIKNVSFELAKLHYRNGELEKAYTHLLNSKILGDSIVDQDHQSNVSTLESKYKLVQTSIDNKILIREGIVKDKYIKKQKRNNRIIGALLILTSIFGYVLFMGRRKLKRINIQFKEANSLLEAKSAELNSYNAALERTFSVVSHDLKGPIGTADSFFQMLNDKNISITNDQRDNYIKIVGNSMSVTYNMLEELLVWSKHRIINKIDFKEFSLYELVYSIIGNIETTVFTKNISIINNIEMDSIINSDRNYLRIVIRNIITNAIKFTNKNGKIVISLIYNDLGCIIKIEDDGVGMSDDVLKQLFNEYDSHKGTNNEQGNGLGLMISRDIIKTIGGDISVESKLGQGSVFSIMLSRNKG